MAELSNPGRNGGRLIRHPKGVSGNPNGRHKKLPELDKLLADVLGDDGKGKSEARAILSALLQKAKRGDVRASEVLLERAYGKVKQELDHSGIPSVQLPIINVIVEAPSADAK